MLHPCTLDVEPSNGFSSRDRPFAPLAAYLDNAIGSIIEGPIR